jgi:hypothetical protein
MSAMPFTTQAVKTTAFDWVPTTPFTRIHGHPSRSNYKILKQEAATIASNVEDISQDAKIHLAPFIFMV